MKIALTLSALALALGPTFAAAAGCSDKVKDETAANCMAGYTWDTATGTCVQTPSS